MKWFVPTTVVQDGEAREVFVDVVPLLDRLLGISGAKDAYRPGLDPNDPNAFYRAFFPNGLEEPVTVKPKAPEPTAIVVRGWKYGKQPQTIALIKAVRAFTGTDLLGAKRTVDLLHAPGSFTLSLANASQATRESVISELTELGVDFDAK